jgi:hypothetical protein
MSLSFYVNDDGQLAPHPAAFSARRAVELQSPATVWRRPHRRRVGAATAMAAFITAAVLLIAHRLI